MATLFFLHLPKTGGTSIRHAAAAAFPAERVLTLYGRDRKTTHPAANAIMYERPDLAFEERVALLSRHIVENEIAFFSSHMSSARLACYDPACAFALFRRPEEQVVSYYHFARKQGRTTAPLEAFIEEAKNQNVQSNNFLPARVEELRVVGLLERFPDFVARLNAAFGLDFAPLHKNRRPLLSRIAAPEIGEAVLARIRALNERDLALYEGAREAWSRQGGGG